ncbi:O-Antigen Polymerase family [Nautilia profundicola AmH]|uniref:O-Antigen Polymerase family n=1 Tax=Nautilia profundicola (strain ATCC BAA-1463 / DSM 18972 / AmH) TaxID=598659 RepID=B9L6V7_NAUPA|nr:O-antigen ligase family protein [Nautilia profundicola]ACM92747.1 O-Antigen Polymerase family [Nautilia profundicola AmH]
MSIIKYKNYLDILFLFIFLITLPISHVAAIQNISFGLFILSFIFIYKPKIKIKILWYYKNLLISFFILTLLAFLSLFNTPNIIETLKEIKGEIFFNLIIMLTAFYYFLYIEREKIKIVFFMILIILIIHTLINIFIWYHHGFWPYRAGGLLDSGGGERFGIWVTYMLAMSFTFLYNKKIFVILFLLSVISIIANQTRATFIASILILFSAMLLKRIFNFKLILLMFLFLIGIYLLISKDLSNKRYNIYQYIDNIHKVFILPPHNFRQIKIESSSLQRLSMWKSALIYRVEQPFIPIEYGRFLYGDSIKEVFKNEPKNLPIRVYSQVHNEFLGILFGLGIFGLIAFLYIIFYNLYIAKNLYKRTHDILYKQYALFVYLGTLGFIVSMMFGSFFGDSESKFFYFLYGLLLALNIKEKNENHSS